MFVFISMPVAFLNTYCIFFFIFNIFIHIFLYGRDAFFKSIIYYFFGDVLLMFDDEVQNGKD